VADEHPIFDLDAIADEGVTLDLAGRSDLGAALDLDEGADPGPVPDPAPVEVGERLDYDSITELDVVDRPVGGLVGG
jgi:hypothetical protein